jgi:hypothetical protein
MVGGRAGVGLTPLKKILGLIGEFQMQIAKSYLKKILAR